MSDEPRDRLDELDLLYGRGERVLFDGARSDVVLTVGNRVLGENYLRHIGRLFAKDVPMLILSDLESESFARLERRKTIFDMSPRGMVLDAIHFFSLMDSIREITFTLTLPRGPKRAKAKRRQVVEAIRRRNGWKKHLRKGRK